MPTRPALIGPDGQAVSFRELVDLAHRVAVTLSDMGVESGDAVAVDVEHWLHHFVIRLAAGRLGARITPLPGVHAATSTGAVAPPPRLAVADQVAARSLAGIRDHLPALRFAVGGPVLGWSDYSDLMGTDGKARTRSRRLDPGPDACLAAMTLRRFDITRVDGTHLVFGTALGGSAGHVAAMFLHCGHTLVVPRQIEATAVNTIVDRHRVTSIQLDPAKLADLLVVGEFDASAVDVLLVTGTPPRPDSVAHADALWDSVTCHRLGGASGLSNTGGMRNAVHVNRFDTSSRRASRRAAIAWGCAANKNGSQPK